MAPSDWSRRDLLKSAATGAVVLGLGAGAVTDTGRYIVGTQADEGDAVRAAMAVADSAPDRIDLGPYGTLVEGVFSTARRQSLLAREDVTFVQPDRVLEHPTTEADGDATDGQVLPWGVDRVDADVALEDGRTGEEVDVGIVDGGIDGSHPDLSANLADPDVEGNHRAWQECSGDHCEEPWYDDGDHGTHVAGTVAAADGDEGVVGVAPGAKLHALKVCSSAGRCRTSDIAEAIKHAADEDWDVVNLSLGSPRESPALRSAGQYAREQGLVLVAAAGNRGEPDSVGYPAAYGEFVAVSATNMDDGVAEFSSRGEEVDVAAPGAEVCSGVVGGHGVFDGTSMASPHVTGAVAQLVAQGYEDGAIRERLAGTAEDIGLSETEQGAGLVDVAAALGLDSDDDGTGDGTACPT